MYVCACVFVCVCVFVCIFVCVCTRVCVSVCVSRQITHSSLHLQGDEYSSIAQLFGGSSVAYIVIIAFFATTILNMEGCLMVLVSNFIGKENRYELKNRSMCTY